MLAVALPGRAYPVTLPALASVTDVLVEHGYDVRPVAWTPPDPLPADPTPWVVERLLEALDGAVPALVVGKSLGTRACGHAAEQGWPAIWVTPLLTDDGCVAALRANPAPQLLVCGAADPFHDRAVARDLADTSTCEVLELPGLDHVLSETGDGVMSDAAISRVGAATTAFLPRLEP